MLVWQGAREIHSAALALKLPIPPLAQSPLLWYVTAINTPRCLRNLGKSGGDAKMWHVPPRRPRIGACSWEEVLTQMGGRFMGGRT